MKSNTYFPCFTHRKTGLLVATRDINMAWDSKMADAAWVPVLPPFLSCCLCRWAADSRRGTHRWTAVCWLCLLSRLVCAGGRWAADSRRETDELAAWLVLLPSWLKLTCQLPRCPSQILGQLKPFSLSPKVRSDSVFMLLFLLPSSLPYSYFFQVSGTHY